MTQHLAYPPACHGWYYFRPYNVRQLPEIQQMTMSWGGDPRNPYADDIFQRVYDRRDNSSMTPAPQRLHFVRHYSWEKNAEKAEK